MPNRFLKQLKKELPLWVERGWITPGGDQAILDHVRQQRDEGIFIHALGILGVILLGSGVITFFAANWSEMGKLSKLAVLLGSLWISYGIAGNLLSRGEHPKTGQALLLLAVILFGANVMLIAQIYHIDAHFPNGVLLWSAGALLTALLLPSQPAMVAALALMALWTGLESQLYDHIHLWFLPLWIITLPRIHTKQWRFALHTAMIALLLWSLFTFFTVGSLSYWRSNHQLYLTETYALIYLALFIVGMLMETMERFKAQADTVKRYSILATLGCFYALTFPRLQSGLSAWLKKMPLRESADYVWVILLFVLLALVSLLGLWHRQRTLSQQRPHYLIWGQLLLGAIVALLIINLFIGGKYGGIMAITFNLLYFAGLVWLILAGRETQDRFLINIAFTFFALTLLSRYFDTFWSLMNRSFFFMGGGLILLAGGYLLERQRRQLTRDIGHREQEELA